MGAYWDGFLSGILNYAKEGYGPLTDWVFPIVFVGIAVFSYFYTGSATVAAVIIIVTMGIYGADLFVGFPEITMMMYIIVLLVLAVLFTFLFIKRRN